MDKELRQWLFERTVGQSGPSLEHAKFQWWGSGGGGEVKLILAPK